MSTPIITTKLYVPKPPSNLVPRTHLIEKLNKHLEGKLTLVSAPAGFGKTTLLSEFVENCKYPTAWLSLDDRDNDPARFLGYLTAALQKIDQSIGKGVWNVLSSPPPLPIDSILADLINDIARTPDQLVMVFDDYHVIESQEIDQAIIYLLSNLPQQMHLVIASRTDPTLPLPRLRSQGQLVEIRADDLRFSPEEATCLLENWMGFKIPAKAITTLDARTEGWVTGLQLAAISMQGLKKQNDIYRFVNSFSSSHRYVLDYLTDEVLSQRPKGTREFLLQTSILDRLGASVCNAVTEQDNGQEILEALEAANLFLMPLDNERNWYRYHHLFGDLLQARLKRHTPNIIPELHRRASTWYENHGLISDAVKHALSAEDFNKAADLVEQIAKKMLERSELAGLLDLVSTIPDEYVRPRPLLCIYHAWALRLSGRPYQAVEARLDDTEKALKQQSISESEKHRLQGHLAALRAFQSLFSEDIPRTLNLAQQALQYNLEENFVRSSILFALGWAQRFSGDLIAAKKTFSEAQIVSMESGNIYMAVTSSCRSAYGQVLGGELRKANKNFQEAIRIASLEGNVRLPVAGYPYVYMGGILYEWNELEISRQYLVEGIDLCKQVGFIMDQAIGYVYLAQVEKALGNLNGAQEAIQEAKNLSQKMKTYIYVRRWVENCQVKLWLYQRDFESLSHWIQDTSLNIDDDLDFRRDLDHIILARALTGLGIEYPESSFGKDALILLGRLQEKAESAKWAGKLIEISILQALALKARERKEEALISLGKALTLAEPEGYVRIFLDEGAPIAELLEQAADDGIAPDYVNRLLLAFGEEIDESTEQNFPLPSSLVEPLSEREFEVLNLLADGATNQEIAGELVIAVTTAKKHVSNIIGKLEVTNRTQAVARARELNLI